MRIDALTVALRPRSSWEAIELGTALVRRHAGAVWRPWLALALPAFALVNALGWALDVLWLAPVVLWWLKPLFDRLPLFVLSRAVFGEVPDTRTTLRQAFRGGGRAMLGYLTWRRWSLARSLLMPVDVLEGGDPSQIATRRRVLAGSAYGVASLAWLVFFHFESAVMLGLAALVFLFLPPEYLVSSLQLLWQHLQDAPAWLLLVQNAMLWAATCFVEPFYVGAGFGQYLNRRTELEGWDIELAFRRLRERLLAATTALALVAGVLLAPMPSHAQDAPERTTAPQCRMPDYDETPLEQAFGGQYRKATSFDRAAERVYEDPRLSPKRKVTTWKPRRESPESPDDWKPPRWLAAIGAFVATAGELLLWGLVGALVLLLALTARRWWPWLRSMGSEPIARPASPVERDLPEVEPLPEDIVGTARRHWAAGRPREALALVYRAAVESMLATTGRVLPPGATEAQCLRAASALPDEQRAAFAAVVRQWQHVAYADRVPEAEAFDAMLDAAAARFGWAA